MFGSRVARLELPGMFMHKPPLTWRLFRGPPHRNMRRAHDSLGANPYVEDKDTGELRRSHHIDLKTGTYRGRQVMTPKED